MYNEINEVILDFEITNDELNFIIDEEFIVEGGGGDRLPDYKGSYRITPKTSEIKLFTKNKSMTDDVTIYQIPYSATDNMAGGKTITIGLE